jgi:adenylylsulfate kinase-like enzyme
MTAMAGVIWITGLSGAGKTTLAKRVVGALRDDDAFARGGVVHVDGDRMREIFGSDLGHDAKDRRKNAWRVARTCAFLAGEGCFVVCSTMSMFQDIWTHNRATFDPYLEVLLAVPVEILRVRDTKGLYRAGVRNVGGVDLEITWPKTPDLVLSSEGEADLARNTQLLVARAKDLAAGRASRRTA